MLIYSNHPPYEKQDKLSIFLMGGTPRSEDVKSWRPEAIQYLQETFDDIDIILPDSNSGIRICYEDQVEWETIGLENCSVILAWVPRNMETMPCLTTNVEFGMWIIKNPNKLFYGRPDDAFAIKYLDHWYTKNTNRTPQNNLKTLIQCIFQQLK